MSDDTRSAENPPGGAGPFDAIQFIGEEPDGKNDTDSLFEEVALRALERGSCISGSFMLATSEEYWEWCVRRIRWEYNIERQEDMRVGPIAHDGQSPSSQEAPKS